MLTFAEGIGLKPNKNRHETTVVVAMSGGVDSSVAASLLVEAGYNCIGVMMRLWAESGAGEGSSNKCCSLESVNDARAVADALGIPFYLINVEQPFKSHVVDSFIEGHRSGLTPNPCMACNRHIRFDYLLNYARRLGADFLATGHYAQLRRNPGGQVELIKGVDEAKDQSYVLSMLGQAELNDVLFPIGGLPKAEVRRIAAERGLPVASKHDSMDLCFVFDDDYRRFLRDWASDSMRPGPIVDRQGKLWGMHGGLPNYTVGQRKGLGSGGSPEPLFVLELDHVRNALVVGGAAGLGRLSFRALEASWTTSPPAAGTRALVKIRYKARLVACTLAEVSGDRVTVLLDEPLRDVTPGQSAVFHSAAEGEHILGCATIALDEVNPDSESHAEEQGGDSAQSVAAPVTLPG